MYRVKLSIEKKPGKGIAVVDPYVLHVVSSLLILHVHNLQNRPKL